MGKNVQSQSLISKSKTRSHYSASPISVNAAQSIAMGSLSLYLALPDEVPWPCQDWLVDFGKTSSLAWRWVRPG